MIIQHTPAQKYNEGTISVRLIPVICGSPSIIGFVVDTVSGDFQLANPIGGRNPLCSMKSRNGIAGSDMKAVIPMLYFSLMLNRQRIL